MLFLNNDSLNDYTDVLFLVFLYFSIKWHTACQNCREILKITEGTFTFHLLFFFFFFF